MLHSVAQRTRERNSARAVGLRTPFETTARLNRV
jgi:hypothetical protein